MKIPFLMKKSEPCKKLCKTTRFTFEIGKSYVHTSGREMSIVGFAKTYAYDWTLIGEETNGSLIPVGGDETATVGWSCVGYVEQRERFNDLLFTFCVTRFQAQSRPDHVRLFINETKDHFEDSSDALQEFFNFEKMAEDGRIMISAT